MKEGSKNGMITEREDLVITIARLQKRVLDIDARLQVPEIDASSNSKLVGLEAIQFTGMPLKEVICRVLERESPRELSAPQIRGIAESGGVRSNSKNLTRVVYGVCRRLSRDGKVNMRRTPGRTVFSLKRKGSV